LWGLKLIQDKFIREIWDKIDDVSTWGGEDRGRMVDVMVDFLVGSGYGYGCLAWRCPAFAGCWSLILSPLDVVISKFITGHIKN